MALVIRDTGVVPPERWHYIIEETNFPQYAPNWTALLSMVNVHCKSNGLRERSEQEIIDQVCQRLTVDCYEQETKVPLVNRFSLGLPAPVTSCCGKR